MAEKKATKVAATKAAAPKKEVKKAAAPKAAAKKATLVINAENAGFKAGDVYQALATANKALTVAEIAKAARLLRQLRSATKRLSSVQDGCSRRVRLLMQRVRLHLHNYNSRNTKKRTCTFWHILFFLTLNPQTLPPRRKRHIVIGFPHRRRTLFQPTTIHLQFRFTPSFSFF